MLTVLAAAFVAAAAGGCVERLNPEDFVDNDGPEISILVRLPRGSIPFTKGSVDALDNESKIYSLQIWTFLHQDPTAEGYDDALPLAYTVLSDIGGWRNQNPYEGGDWNEDVYTIRIHLPGRVLHMEAEDLKLDFFVLANGGSLGALASDNREYRMTRSEVRDMSFGYDDVTGGDPFGAMPCLSVPQNIGLPMSAYYDAGADVSFLLTNPHPSISVIQEFIPVIQLRRAVTRIRFAFSRLRNMNYVYINKIRIIQNPEVSETDEAVIPEREYVFNHSEQTSGVVVPSTNPSYEIVIWDANLDYRTIRQTTNPAALVRGDMTPEEYDAFLWEDLASESPATTQQLLYLRETNRHLAVEIDYAFDRYDDQGHLVKEPHALVIPFQGSNVVFPRNYTANLYAYFLEDAILFSVSCDEWSLENVSHTNLTPEE